MPAYMIVYASINDREKFLAGYAPVASRLVEKFGGKYLVRAQGADVLEGSLKPGMSVVISQWPDKQSILDFWNSSEYQAAKRLREDVADCEVTIIDTPDS